MITKKRATIYRLLVTGVALVMIAAGQSVAEVGAILDSNDNADKKIGFVFTMVDDPDPFPPAAWKQFSGGSGRAILNPEGFANEDGTPSMIHNKVSDLVIVAWALNSPSGFDVVVSYLGDETWSAPEIVAGSVNDELDPKLVIDPSDGAVHLVYWVDDPTPRVMLRSSPADLSSWSPPVQVSDVGEPACRPHGVVHDGTLHVVYEAHNTGIGQPPLEIVMATRDGSIFTTETVEISYYPEKNWPEIHSAADALWIDWVDSDQQVAWVRLNAQGQWEPIEFAPYSSVEELYFGVRGGIRLQILQGP